MRADGGNGEGVARPDQSCHRRRRAGGGQTVAGPAPFGHRLFGQEPAVRGEAFVTVKLCATLAIGLAVLTIAAPASATTIERIVSPGGIEAWLVREAAAPPVVRSEENT